MFPVDPHGHIRSRVLPWFLAFLVTVTSIVALLLGPDEASAETAPAGAPHPTATVAAPPPSAGT